MVADTELDSWLAESYPAAYRTACLILRVPADAEDAVQDAFLRVWRFRDAIPAGDARRGWLYRVVVNACLSRMRHDRPWRQRADEAVLEHRPHPGGSRDPQDPAGEAEAAALATAVAAAVAALPEPLRIPVILRYYTGLAEREIALAIKRRPGTVKSRLFEARRRLAADPALAAWAAVDLEVAK